MDLIIIGGGASGMMAAIAAKRQNPDANVTILERKDRIGKKLLATGNGRCNFTNMQATVDHYAWLEPKALSSFVQTVLGSFSVADTIAFFEQLGIVHKIGKNGKVYPFSDQASAMLDVLRNEMDRLSVSIVTGFEVKQLIKDKMFRLVSSEGDELRGDRVIVAAGGCASKTLGSNGTGFLLMQALGHHITPLHPALVQMKTSDVKSLKGIKCFCDVTLKEGGQPLHTEYGEVLFVDYGLSGPPVFQLTNLLPNRKNLQVCLDFMPEMEEADLYTLLRRRAETLRHVTMEHFFTGFLNKRIGNAVAKKSGIEKLSLPVGALTDQQLALFSRTIKCFTLDVLGTNDFNSAQVTAGGVYMSEFDCHTLESKRVKGLFAAGELLDVYGDCGGFNLQWAWSSGFVAGYHASKPQ